MWSKSLFALAGASLCLHAAAATASSNCGDYVIVETRGTYELQNRPSIAFKNMTAETLKTLPNGLSHHTVYPANTNQSSVFKGAAAIVDYVDSGLKSCPEQKYALLGYSQGAEATAIALRNYTNPTSAGYQAIAGVLLVGNPGFKPFQAANVDQAGNLTTTAFTGSAYLEGRNVPLAWYQSAKLIDICYNGDIVCNGVTGTSNLKDHLKYGSTASVQRIGTSFLVASLTPQRW